MNRSPRASTTFFKRLEHNLADSSDFQAASAVHCQKYGSALFRVQLQPVILQSSTQYVVNRENKEYHFFQLLGTPTFRRPQKRYFVSQKFNSRPSRATATAMSSAVRIHAFSLDTVKAGSLLAALEKGWIALCRLL